MNDRSECAVAAVSIIVTAYNIGDYIEQCLDSIAAQTLTDLEVLVVDDGSTDSTAQQIVDFCADDPRFIPVLLPANSPGGVATAANAGLDRATAPWVGFVDGDDYIEPAMFERLVGAAAAADADLALCQYQEVVAGSGELGEPADAHRWAELTGTRYELDLASRKQFLRLISVPWRKLYRRSLLEDEGIRFPVSDSFYEDNPFHWFALVAARSVALVPEVLYYHRVARSGQTMGAADERLLQVFRHHDTIHSWLAGRRLLDLYQSTLVGWVISQLEWIAWQVPPPLRRPLFDTLVPIFAGYSWPTIAGALRDGNKGAAAQRMSAAIAQRDYDRFARTFASRPTSPNPLVTAAFHLRHSGVRHTALLTRRYLDQVLKGTRASRTVGRVRRVGRAGGESGQQDVMFALMVLQQRLGGLESRLGAMADRLANVERLVEDAAGRLERLSGVDEQGRYDSAALGRLEDPVGRS